MTVEIAEYKKLFQLEKYPCVEPPQVVEQLHET